jgi:hypothetical protein
MSSLLSSSDEQQLSPQAILDLLDAMHQFLPKSPAMMSRNMLCI